MLSTPGIAHLVATDSTQPVASVISFVSTNVTDSDQHYRPMLGIQHSHPTSELCNSFSIIYQLQGEVKNVLEVLQPLNVTLELDEDGIFLAYDDQTLMYGTGESFSEALDDYECALIEYATRLGKREDAESKELFAYISGIMKIIDVSK